MRGIYVCGQWKTADRYALDEIFEFLSKNRLGYREIFGEAAGGIAKYPKHPHRESALWSERRKVNRGKRRREHVKWREKKNETEYA